MQIGLKLRAAPFILENPNLLNMLMAVYLAPLYLMYVALTVAF